MRLMVVHPELPFHHEYFAFCLKLERFLHGNHTCDHFPVSSICLLRTVPNKVFSKSLLVAKQEFDVPLCHSEMKNYWYGCVNSW